MGPFVAGSGVCVIAPTAFHDDGTIDYGALERMTDAFLGFGVTGIAVLGQMGEAPKLDHQEALTVAIRVIEPPSVPVIVRGRTFRRPRLSVALQRDYERERHPAYRGILASDAQRKPATTLSACARAEVEYLLSRIARAGKRAHLGSPS